jgi:hypothetical protein
VIPRLYGLRYSRQMSLRDEITEIVKYEISDAPLAQRT